ncbi:MAG: sn-glycerol-3-phosphate ABC transporter ATP-binding protein UgpC, partial [Pseudomonadota bacterium]|nr:sn-glycerol-3-phosphate ABC transporter ATP-binding protein UgpC [Pseudomonadota bacterium]
MADVLLKSISKSYGATAVLHGIDLDVKDGEFVVFVGPSGCGKSTLLRIIAGLESITAGDLFIGGRRMNDVPPAERRIAMVFQSYALYPHMTVYRNMAFGLKFAKTDKADADRRVRHAAEILGLTPLLDRKPAALSGGQRQRVAIGRAIVREPAVFLFDEPLSNLDAALRINTRVEIAKLHRELRATTIYVTHDQIEAMTLANKIVVMNAGRVEQIGSPLDLYHRPANLFVAGFIGSPRMNFIHGRVEASRPGIAILSVNGGEIALPAPAAELAEGESITIGVRPEHMLEGGDGALRLDGEVEAVEHLGEASLVYLKLADGADVIVRAPDETRAEPGGRYAASAPDRGLHLFRADGSAVS